MNHRPFEDWLLEDIPLTPEQARDLQAHLRTCTTCASLMEVNAALRLTKQAAPAPGFSARFQVRLAVRKAEQRRRNIAGLVLLVVMGVGLIGWVAYPYVVAAAQSPGNIFISWLASVILFLTTLQTYGQVVEIFLRTIAGIIPIFAWMIVSSAFAGLLLMWSFTFWKSTTLTMSVRSVS
jgi:hypothetical protein